MVNSKVILTLTPEGFALPSFPRGCSGGMTDSKIPLKKKAKLVFTRLSAGGAHKKSSCQNPEDCPLETGPEEMRARNQPGESAHRTPAG